MIRFYVQKLVRDKVVEHSVRDPEIPHVAYHVLDTHAFRHELQRKIHEEADEIPLEDENRPEAIKELADLQEVVDALREELDISPDEVQQAMTRKKQAKGGFHKRHYVSYFDLQETSPWVAVFRQQPEKYREKSST